MGTEETINPHQLLTPQKNKILVKRHTNFHHPKQTTVPLTPLL